jgi:nitrogen fixation protein FixH
MKTPRNLWPMAIVLTLVLFFCGIMTLVVIASSQKVDLVSDNYYEQELKYQGSIDSLERAKPLGAKATYDAPGRRIVLSLPAGQTRRNLTGAIQLYRPSEAGLDQELSLAPNSDGVQAVDASRLQPGLWKVRVSWAVEGRDYLFRCSFTNLAGSPSVR